MRYCINCGSELNSERFCTVCGTDNGVPVKSVEPGVSGSSTSAQDFQNIDLMTVLHWVSTALFAVASLVLLIACCGAAQQVIAFSMLYTLGWVFACVYFVIGMWKRCACVDVLS